VYVAIASFLKLIFTCR